MLRHITEHNYYTQVKRFFEQYERLLMPGTMVLGFVLDILTFKSIEVNTAFVLLGIHLVLVTAAITYLNIYREAPQTATAWKYLRVVAPLVLQFSLGALLSSSLIFYSFSSAITVSWPLLGTLAFLMLSNEIYKQYYLRPMVQFTVYFFVLFALSSIMLPFFFASISPGLFILAGGGSLGITGFYVKLIAKRSSAVDMRRGRLVRSIGITYIIMNVLYFTNVIPPVPLTVRDAGIHHEVSRSGPKYRIVAEHESFFRKLVPTITMHIKPGEPVYAYTAIFAPSELDTDIVHHWQYYDEKRHEWVTAGRARYPLIGGREDGYRGYSFWRNLREGTWRVYVETERGQIMGKIRFRVTYADPKTERAILWK